MAVLFYTVRFAYTPPLSFDGGVEFHRDEDFEQSAL